MSVDGFVSGFPQSPVYTYRSFEPGLTLTQPLGGGVRDLPVEKVSLTVPAVIFDDCTWVGDESVRQTIPTW